MDNFQFLYCDKCQKPFKNIYEIGYCWEEMTDFDCDLNETTILNLVILHKGFKNAMTIRMRIQVEL